MHGCSSCNENKDLDVMWWSWLFDLQSGVSILLEVFIGHTKSQVKASCLIKHVAIKVHNFFNAKEYVPTTKKLNLVFS